MPIPERPHRYSKPVINRAAELLADQLVKSGVLASGERKDSLESLADALTLESDGYKIAKHLDDMCCWEISAHEVEELDYAHLALAEAETEAVGLWVKAYQVKLDLAVGDRVEAEVNGETKQGTIVSLAPAMARYNVHTDDLKIKTSYYVLPAERVKLLASSQPEAA